MPMRFIQLNQPRHIPVIVGRIILEDSNGKPSWTVLYNVHPVRRERTLFCEDGIYLQHHQDPTGVWHYRFDRQRCGLRVNEDLSDYQPIVHPKCPTCGREL